MNVADRFNAKFVPEPNTGCWLWTACVNQGGYGLFNFNGKIRLAHRVSIEMAGVNIPEGASVLHSCDNPSCVNPDHLRVGDARQNAADMIARKRNTKTIMSARCRVGFLSASYGVRRVTHCPRGHEFTAENTRISKENKRHCRACNRLHQRAYMKRKEVQHANF